MPRFCQVGDDAYVNLDQCVWARIDLRAPSNPDQLILGLQNNSLIETSFPGSVQAVQDVPAEAWTEIPLADEEQKRFWINLSLLESVWVGEDEHGSYLSVRFARGQESRLDDEHFPVAAIRELLASQ